MKHPVMWFEVLGKDAGKLCQFYGALFGWSFGGDPSAYGLVQSNGRGIPGGVGVSYPGTREWVTFYVETPDITASLAHVEHLGGRVVMSRTVMPGVTLGIFEDPEGHAIGLVEAQAASWHNPPMRRADRLFQIVNALRRRRTATTAAHLAERLGVSERTVYRDIRDLIPAGGIAPLSNMPNILGSSRLAIPAPRSWTYATSLFQGTS